MVRTPPFLKPFRTDVTPSSHWVSVCVFPVQVVATSAQQPRHGLLPESDSSHYPHIHHRHPTFFSNLPPLGGSFVHVSSSDRACTLVCVCAGACVSMYHPDTICPYDHRWHFGDLILYAIALDRTLDRPRVCERTPTSCGLEPQPSAPNRLARCACLV